MAENEEGGNDLMFPCYSTWADPRGSCHWVPDDECPPLIYDRAEDENDWEDEHEEDENPEDEHDLFED